MELTAEAIKSNPALAEVSDEQAAAIAEVANDAIGKTIGEVHRKYDETILKATGIEREGNEKSYLYLERAGTALRAQAEKATELSGEIETLSAERDRLSGLVEKGGDAALKSRLDDANRELGDLKTKFQEAQEQLQSQGAEYESKLTNQRIDLTLQSAASGLNFKKEIPENLIPLAVNEAVNKIKGFDPSFDESGRLVFKNEDGVIIKNDKAEPMSASELLKRELASSLETGRKQTGGGTGGANGSGTGGVSLDISTCKTKQEAYTLISQHLGERGLIKGTTKYADAQSEIINARADFDSLPLGEGA